MIPFRSGGNWMFGLILRLVLLFAVVFGIVYGITRARRANAHSAAAKRIQDDIRALKAGLEEGLYTDVEYREFATRIEQDCRREGIEVPELPELIQSRGAKRKS